MREEGETTKDSVANQGEVANVLVEVNKNYEGNGVKGIGGHASPYIGKEEQTIQTGNVLLYSTKYAYVCG
jgi:hypothetical protein